MKKAVSILGLIMVIALTAAGCEAPTGEKTVTVTKTVTPTSSYVTTQAAAPAAPAAPASFNGTGTTATAKFSLYEGLYRITLAHDGKRNFQVELMDAKGNTVEYLMNKIGVVNENKALRINNAGDYLLNIEADGNWNITFQAE